MIEASDCANSGISQGTSPPDLLYQLFPVAIVAGVGRISQAEPSAFHPQQRLSRKGRGRPHWTVAQTVGTLLNRVLNRGERFEDGDPAGACLMSV